MQYLHVDGRSSRAPAPHAGHRTRATARTHEGCMKRDLRSRREEEQASSLIYRTRSLWSRMAGAQTHVRERLVSQSYREERFGEWM